MSKCYFWVIVLETEQFNNICSNVIWVSTLWNSIMWRIQLSTILFCYNPLPSLIFNSVRLEIRYGFLPIQISNLVTHWSSILAKLRIISTSGISFPVVSQKQTLIFWFALYFNISPVLYPCHTLSFPTPPVSETHINFMILASTRVRVEHPHC